MQLADFLSAVFFYLKVGENLNQNWIVENLNNAFSTWNGKLGELWGLVTTGPQTFKGGAVWSVMQTLHNGMVGIGYALVVLFFAISLCKNTMNFHELKRPEAAIHYFLRFVAAKALVGYGILNVAVRGEIAFALSATTPGRLTVCRLTGFTDMQMMTRLRRFADVGSRISTCFLRIGVHAERFTPQNKRKEAFSMICPLYSFQCFISLFAI